MTEEKIYRLAEPVFFSLQGEGSFVGTPALFIRFAGCNLACDVQTVGFNCDTKYDTKIFYTKNQLASVIADCLHNKLNPTHIVLTGGEPLLQLDVELLKMLYHLFFIHIETNGTIEIPKELNDYIYWIACSPKDGHPCKLKFAHEIRLVVDTRERFDRLRMQHNSLLSEYNTACFLSPAWGNRESLQTCIDLVKENTDWRLSCQMHKYINIP